MILNFDATSASLRLVGATPWRGLLWDLQLDARYPAVADGEKCSAPARGLAPVDECAAGTHTCDANAICTDTDIALDGVGYSALQGGVQFSPGLNALI